MSNLGSDSDVSLVLGCGGYLASDISEITTTMPWRTAYSSILDFPQHVN